MIQPLRIWCKEIVNSAITQMVPQRRPLVPEEELNGWLNLQTVSAQQLNSLFFQLTTYSSPSPYTFYMISSSTPTPSEALDANGQTLTIEDSPELYEHFGATLPNANTSAPSGFKFIIRNM